MTSTTAINQIRNHANFEELVTFKENYGRKHESYSRLIYDKSDRTYLYHEWDQWDNGHEITETTNTYEDVDLSVCSAEVVQLIADHKKKLGL